jgi:hypothetical protein
MDERNNNREVVTMTKADLMDVMKQQNNATVTPQTPPTQSSSFSEPKYSALEILGAFVVGGLVAYVVGPLVAGGTVVAAGIKAARSI